MKILKTVLLTTLLTTLTTTAVADTTLTFTNKKDNIAMKMQIANNMMRTTSVGDNSTYMIYDANNATFSVFDSKEKSYFVMGKKAIENLSDISAMMDKMLEKQLRDMPESQRAMMRGMLEKTMKARMPKEMPKPEYSFTGETKSYNGIDCEVVKKKTKREKSEFCVVKYSDVGMTAAEYAVIQSLQDIIQKMSQQFGNDHSMDFSSLGKYIPVKYKQAGESGTLQDVNHDKLDSSLFIPPADFKRQEMPF